MENAQAIRQLAELFGDFHDAVISDFHYYFAASEKETSRIEIKMQAMTLTPENSWSSMRLVLHDILEVKFQERNTSNCVIFGAQFIQDGSSIIVDFDSPACAKTSIEEVRSSDFYVVCRNLQFEQTRLE
jgi:hypothetical protein